ncbi:MAG TPA: PLD nuclease N-terminal domain-containing protein [Mycobacteriales bacterium]|nr:PLD nuclease N-terminal domain-containing protein [Mycobacteriales bacterium]
MTHKKWSELSGPAKANIIVAGAVQLALAATAWWDLSRRPADDVHGPKLAWALVIGINFVGPVAYLRLGRKSGARIPLPPVPPD